MKRQRAVQRGGASCGSEHAPCGEIQDGAATKRRAQPLGGAEAAPREVAVVVAVHNTTEYLDACFESVLAQTALSSLEVVVYDDASDAACRAKLAEWCQRFAAEGVPCTVAGPCWADNQPVSSADSPASQPVGCGKARNAAVSMTSLPFICVLDSDDYMLPRRVELQLELARLHPESIVGSQFRRDPPDSTRHYVAWLNALSEPDLRLQQFRELTLIQPTWFFHRQVWDRAGGWPECAQEGAVTVPDDMDFWYRHLGRGGGLRRVDEELVVYRCRPGSQSFRTPRRTLLHHRARAFDSMVAAHWGPFTIWGAGRDAKQFYAELTAESRRKVRCMVDVDEKKLRAGTYHHAHLHESVPIRPLAELTAPFVVCVVRGRHDGAVERNVTALTAGLTEGEDYWHFC